MIVTVHMVPCPIASIINELSILQFEYTKETRLIGKNKGSGNTNVNKTSCYYRKLSCWNSAAWYQI